jgi:hypothetical protein
MLHQIETRDTCVGILFESWVNDPIGDISHTNEGGYGRWHSYPNDLNVIPGCANFYLCQVGVFIFVDIFFG